MLGAKHCAHILLREPKYCGIHQSAGGFVKQQYIASLDGILSRGPPLSVTFWPVQLP